MNLKLVEERWTIEPEEGKDPLSAFSPLTFEKYSTDNRPSFFSVPVFSSVMICF
jgi:hypothetical protein